MTPQEKALKLVKMFNPILNYDFVSDLQWHDPNNADRNRRVKKDAKKCALIAVDEILDLYAIHYTYYTLEFKYWQEVKKQLEKI